MMKKKSWMNQTNFIAVMVSFILGYILSALLVYQTYNSDKILDQGKVYDFSWEECTKDGDGIRYDYEKRKYVIMEEQGALLFTKIDESVGWRYLYIKMGDFPGEVLPAELTYFNKDNAAFGSQYVDLVNGDNYITMAVNEGCISFAMDIQGKKGESFSLDRVQIRRHLPKSWKNIVILTFVFGFLFCLIWKVFCVFLLKDKVNHKKMDFLLPKICRFVYGKIGSDVYDSLKNTRIYEKKEKIRTCLFLILFAGTIYARQQAYDIKRETYKYCIFVALILLLMLGFLCVEGKRKTEVWTGNLSKIWFCFWIMAGISDFLASKHYKFVGWVMLFGVGMFFYHWRQMECPEQIWMEVINALRYLFYPGVIYCLVFRPKTGGVLYNGFCLTSEEFGVYALVMTLVFLVHLHGVLKEENRVLLFDGVGLVICFYYFVVTGVFLCQILAVLFSGAFLWGNKQNIRIRKAIIIILGAGLFMMGFHWNVRYLPGVLGTEVVYENEVKETLKSGEILRQLKEMDPVTYENVKQKNLYDRVLVLKAYARKLNVQGNSKASLSLWGNRELCRNGILEMMYRYGIFIVIPYTLMLYVLCRKMAVSLKNRREFSPDLFLEAGITLSFVAVSLCESVEMPFGSPLWLLFYLCLGFYGAE